VRQSDYACACTPPKRNWPAVALAAILTLPRRGACRIRAFAGWRLHRVYDEYSLEKEKRDALLEWERMLLSIIAPSATSNNVVGQKRTV